MKSVEDIKKVFKNSDLFTLALTHKSWVNEHPKERESNERLEFLGDAILEFIVSREIYNKFPDKEEGYLTSLRANLVNTMSLAGVAKKLKIGSELYLSKGEEQEGGRKNTSLLANTMEAIIGALYLDQGVEAAYEFINDNILAELPKIVSKPLKDAKSRLQELVQAKGLPAPRYKVIDEAGPDHAKKFTIEVIVGGKPWGRGVGKSKSEATQVAALNALQSLP